ncbi:hypothetical protein C7H19_15105 [Aphanothece hegewaldii CCALA 016]|uniref:Uncharacterized protein n=1 Tax=Aphanothece hegewaldii CCALA 016 TaxID=2107694 RepID=A0A2T1LVJ7_9CHRO|nr:hypothetical protein C7H19_15105 [Aphanothece hegewaldii CCALA 016]
MPFNSVCELSGNYTVEFSSTKKDKKMSNKSYETLEYFLAHYRLQFHYTVKPKAKYVLQKHIYKLEVMLENFS